MFLRLGPDLVATHVPVLKCRGHALICRSPMVSDLFVTHLKRILNERVTKGGDLGLIRVYSC